MDQKRKTPRTPPPPTGSSVLSEIETTIFHNLIEIMPDAIVIINHAGQIVLINRQTEIMFGYDREELIEQQLDILIPDRFQVVHKKHRIEYFKQPHTRPMGMGLELFGKHKDGSEFPTEISLGPFATKYETFVVSTIRDISDRKRLQIERERLIQEQGIILAREQSLLETNRRMDEFISIASHELKTPMTFLKGGIQVILRRMKRLTAVSETAEYREVFDSIEDLLRESVNQITRLERLIHDLLEVSRMQSGRMVYQDERFDLLALTREVVAEHLLVNPDRSILFTSITGEQALIEADSVRIRQVITNYLANALKYSEDMCTVEVEVTIKDDKARVAVRDEGVGIPEEEQENIWERFYRIKNTKIMSGSGIGLGLGLYLSKTIIQHYNGEVGVQSAQGTGSTFWFTLPLLSS